MFRLPKPHNDTILPDCGRDTEPPESGEHTIRAFILERERDLYGHGIVPDSDPHGARIGDRAAILPGEP